MNRICKKFGLLATVLSLHAGGAVAEEFLVGAEIPLTGAMARVGAGMHEGISVAVEVFNKTNGKHTVKVITADDESAPAKAVAAVEKLAGQGVVAITGGYGSNNIGPASDAANKLGFVRVRLPVRPDIRAGGFGRAVFEDAMGQGLAAPETAVRYDADGASVMVVGADNRVRRVMVTTGQRGGGLVQLVKGPPAGSRVVQNAAAFLLDGDLVRPVEDAAPSAKMTSSVRR